MSKWIKTKKETPLHKDLVLCWDGSNVLPAIYYDNLSFYGFYSFTTFYCPHSITVYCKIKLKDKHRIDNVIKWKLIKEPKK